MNGEFQYSGAVLSNLFEAVGRALPGVIAGLVVIALFLVAAAVARRIFRRVAQRIDPEKRPLAGLAGQTLRYAIVGINFRYAVLDSEGKTVLVPNNTIFGTVIVVE